MRYALPLLFVLSATPALAQQVDASGAKTLTANLSRYIGSTAFEQGVVKIAVDGDAYKMEVDFGKLIGLFPKQDTVTFKIAPYTLRLKPRGDGTWDVAGDASPDGSFTLKTPEGTQTGRWQIADDTFSGIYDPALAGFSIANSKFGPLSFTSSDPKQSSEFTVSSGSFQLQSRKSASSGVDFTMLQTMSDMIQTIRMTDPEAGMDIPIVLRSPELSQGGSATGYQAQPLLDLLAFAVANAEEEKLKAAQPEFKTRLRAVLPLWDQLSGSYGLRDLTVGTPVGIFGAANARFEGAMDGVRKDGTLTYRFLVDDLTVPAGVAPPWTVPLLPEDFDLNFAGTGIDLEGPLTTAIDAFDLNRDPPLPEEVGNMIAAQFLANPPKFVVNRSSIRNNDTEISAQGEMTFAGGKPTFTATVEATGFDATVQAIQKASATAPEAQQAFMVAVAAKGFAKTLSDGRLQWVIDMTPDGAVTVNGAVVKPPDPVAPAPQ